LDLASGRRIASAEAEGDMEPMTDTSVTQTQAPAVSMLQGTPDRDAATNVAEDSKIVRDGGVDETISAIDREIADAGRTMVDEIRTQPLRAVAAAAAIGFVAGWIAAR
jgi:hypothetical protein